MRQMTSLFVGSCCVGLLLKRMCPCWLQLLPSVRHGWLVQELTEEALAQASAAGIDQICPRANATTREAVTAALARGFSVRGWGVKNESLLLHAVHCGMQGATVDWPHRAATVLAASCNV